MPRNATLPRALLPGQGEPRGQLTGPLGSPAAPCETIATPRCSLSRKAVEKRWARQGCACAELLKAHQELYGSAAARLQGNSPLRVCGRSANVRESACAVTRPAGWPLPECEPRLSHGRTLGPSGSVRHDSVRLGLAQGSAQVYLGVLAYYGGTGMPHVVLCVVRYAA